MMKGRLCMEAIKLSVWVDDNKRILLELPADVPVGLAEIVIIPQAASTSIYNPQYPAAWAEKREQLRKKMSVAGILSTAYSVPSGVRQMPPDELLMIGTLPPGIRPTDELIDEERGPR